MTYVSMVPAEEKKFMKIAGVSARGDAIHPEQRHDLDEGCDWKTYHAWIDCCLSL